MVNTNICKLRYFWFGSCLLLAWVPCRRRAVRLLAWSQAPRPGTSTNTNTSTSANASANTNTNTNTSTRGRGLVAA